MNLLLLKKNLQEELKLYNYVLGSKLLCIHLNNLKNKYSVDFQCYNTLSNFSDFLTLILATNEFENVKNGFNILNSINNINALIDLLCFFNPTQYYDMIEK